MKITVSKDELLRILQENRDKHREVFIEAQKAYLEQVTAVFEERAAQARKGRRPDRYVSLEEPKDHTRDYDRVIGMLKMHTGDTFPLDMGEYEQYVQDRWGWSAQNRQTMSTYAAGKFSEVYGEQEEDDD
jgi:hypothetical protein